MNRYREVQTVNWEEERRRRGVVNVQQTSAKRQKQGCASWSTKFETVRLTVVDTLQSKKLSARIGRTRQVRSQDDQLSAISCPLRFQRRDIFRMCRAEQTAPPDSFVT